MTNASHDGPELEEITLRVDDLLFDALVAGPEDGELVLLLHGFPQTGYSYRHQITALAEAGFRAVAPDQRGYSPGARPAEIAEYAMPHLIGDVIGMVDALGRREFHLVGHDWGGAVAWVVASVHPSRINTLSVLSTPHFSALGARLADPESEQAQRSSYFEVFAAPGAEDRFLANDMAFFRGLFQGSGATNEDIQVYLDRLGTPEAMRAALNWYSALVAANKAAAGQPIPPPPAPIQAPTLYVFGTSDLAFSMDAAEATAKYVSGPYDFQVMDGLGHWLLEEAGEVVTDLLVRHITRAR